ncbi:hypothetical protein [Lysobacter sp. CA199]|uniref:hypothetical protein n=1 Tax=Lysobacter sp. CA199 TaxID=3455608 RepID=UPI003F8D20D1
MRTEAVTPLNVRRIAAEALRLGPAAEDVAAITAELLDDPTEIKAALGEFEPEDYDRLDELAVAAFRTGDWAAYTAEMTRALTAAFAARAQAQAEKRQRDSWAAAADGFADMLASRRVSA